VRAVRASVRACVRAWVCLSRFLFFHHLCSLRPLSALRPSGALRILSLLTSRCLVSGAVQSLTRAAHAPPAAGRGGSGRASFGRTRARNPRTDCISLRELCLVLSAVSAQGLGSLSCQMKDSVKSPAYSLISVSLLCCSPWGYVNNVSGSFLRHCLRW
jgi:hypothetical protein